MFNFIRNIIDRLHGFIRSDARDATEPTAEGVMHPVPDEIDVDGDLGRFDRAVLTSSGIRFHGIRYHGAELAQMLSRMSPGDTVKVKIKDPSDASSIFVWDSTARPTPHWITVGIADAPIMLSFAQLTRLRDFARSQQLAFSTEAERSEAWERLKQHWEKLGEQPPMRKSRIADAWDRLTEDNGDITDDPLAQIEEVPLAPEKFRQGRNPSKPAIAKAKRK